MSAVQLEIPPRSPYVAVVRLAVAALARSAGIDEDRVDDLKIAVSEACANAVLSQEELGSPTPVRVEWVEEAARVVVQVHDPVAVTEDPVAERSGDRATRGGMSFALLNSLVDQCDFERDTDGGVTTRLIMVRERVV